MAHILCVAAQLTLRPYRFYLCDRGGLSIFMYRQAMASFGRAKNDDKSICNDLESDGLGRSRRTEIVYMSPTPCHYSCGSCPREIKVKKLS